MNDLVDHVNQMNRVLGDQPMLSDQPLRLQPCDLQMQRGNAPTFALSLLLGTVVRQKGLPRPTCEQRLVEIVRDKALPVREVRFFRTAYHATEEMQDHLRSVVQDRILNDYVRSKEGPGNVPPRQSSSWPILAHALLSRRLSAVRTKIELSGETSVGRTWLGISVSSLDQDVQGKTHHSGTEQQTGLDIDPLEVRLVPGPADPYVWQYGPEQQHLFRKQLSKHNLGAYRQICQHLGRSIWAVLRDGQASRSRSMPDTDSRECLALLGLPGLRSSPKCCGVTVRNTAQELSTEHVSARQELEIKNQSLVARLEVVTSVAEGRHHEIQRLQESQDAMEQRLRELQTTVQLRDAEALRRTKLVEEYWAKEHTMTTLLQGWERGLRTLQVEVGTALQHQTTANDS
ncbi:hypothetical protein LTS08_008768 [Lithohypha guttulata]|nr:hypothetical protein LTS08_008768 [Lithohypha guttulata]